MPLRDAAFTTLGAIALQGFRRAGLSLGERVAVVGLGLLGLLTVQIAKAAGCTVIGVEPDSGRRDLASQFGADAVLAPEGAPERVRDWAAGLGADAVIVTASGASNQIVNDAVSMVRRKGRVVPVGDVGLALERGPLYQREADVLISTSYGPGRYDPLYEEGGIDYPPAYVRWTENRNMEEFLRLLADGKVNVEPLITLDLPVDRAADAYGALRRQPPPLAAVLRYPDAPTRLDSAAASVRVPVARRRTRGESRIVRVGVVGPGSFVRATHLPNLRLDGSAPLVAVAARRGTTATDVARAAGGAAEATTDWRRVVEHPDVELVMIGTRHDSHAEIAAAALRAGKSVFVEKPLGLTRAEIDEVWSAGGGDAAPLMIGFNRTLAPLSQRMRSELAGVSGPLQVVIRVNAPLPSDHWLNDASQGGGRILGEGCHFLDYANWLCGTPTLVSAAAVPAPPGLQTVESASITISYENGSVATVHYSGLGPASLPKERIEVLAGGRAWVLDDFKRLISFEGAGERAVEEGGGDKGHSELIRALLAACRGDRPFLPGLRAGYVAQSVALAALDSIARGATLPVPMPAADYAGRAAT